MKDKIGIVGFGEIGSSLYNLYLDNNIEPYVYDPVIGIYEDIFECQVLNICIPYSNEYVSIVNSYIRTYKPEITVIHSTVAPGTTKKIIGKVCHSPIRGVHPNIKQGIKTFIKYIGSEDKDVSEIYSSHLKNIGVKSYICKDSTTSEYAKLFDTTYYGICISWHSEVMSLCKSENLDFNEVMTNYNNTYNDGYSQLGLSNVIRPVLYPTEKIGGHCIVPNAKILNNYMESYLIDGLLKYE